MKKLFHVLLAAFLRLTHLQYWPVRVRGGVADGARWTLFPWTSYWRGTQEPTMHQALLGFGDIRGWNCWDLGAHFGIYSIGLARRSGPSGQVAAFEPNPLSYGRLERHRRMNRLDTMKTFNAAVSDNTAEAQLYTYGSLDSTTTHLPYDGETPGREAKPLTVLTVKLDDLVATGQLRPPNLIKIDVEGHGHRALAGARQTLCEHLPIIIMGFHCVEEVEGARQILDPLGYQWQPLDPSASADCIGFDYILRPAR